MYQIKLFNKISEAGTDLLDKDNYNFSETLENYDAVLVRSAKLHDTVFPKSLKCIARAGAGVNNIPLDKCAEQGIVVFNTPGANANAVKELVICSLLMSSRRITDGIAWTKTLVGNGDQIGPMAEKGKSSFVGPEIQGKKLGIIGLGAIGVMVANAVIGLGMDVYGYDPFLSVDAALKMSRSVHHSKDLKEIFENCDYITMHVPLTKDTKNMINRDTLATMKPGVRILNFSRGDLVDEAAMIEALDKAHVSCYVTDFPTENLLQASNTIVLPHLGASTPESEDNCAVMAVREVVDFLENGNITNSVNFPDVSIPREKATRICIANRNIPNMVSSISSILAQKGINIENLVNRSKGEYAYTIVDTDSDVSEEDLDSMRNIIGVIALRVIK